MTNALFIGRFQPFHKGHLLLIKNVTSSYEKITIGIGSSQYSHTVENPFSEEERKLMITKTLHAEGIMNYSIVAIPDIHDPPNWVNHVCSIVTDFDVVLTNNLLTKELFEKKGYLVVSTPYFNPQQYCGRTIRNRIINDKSWKEFVPKQVAQVIDDIHGVGRLKTVAA
jgi:nicotinamide-nucleotide adenylyltransferase